MFLKTVFDGGFTIDDNVASVTCAHKSLLHASRHMVIFYQRAGWPSETRLLQNTTTVYVMSDDGKALATFAP